MSKHLNRVTLIGNVGSDPEVKTLKSGSRMATFRLATSESFLDKATKEWKETTQWHSIVIWDESIIKNVERSMKKGTLVMLEGQLLTRSYVGTDGKTQYATEIVLKMYRGLCMPLSNLKSASSSASGLAADMDIVF